MLICNLLDGTEGAGNLTKIVFMMACDYSCYVALPCVPWADPQCLIVVFSGHSH